jgi:solute carrier family 29 (equilibrative nucleoside transporter), member 1/2/3
MFLAAGPYFLLRLESVPALHRNFQSAELAVSTAANLGSMIILTNKQTGASYPKRIIAALLINMTVFTIMTMSTRLFLDISAEGYFAFLMIQIFASSVGTGLMQNGIFAYMAGFGQEKYPQGNMTGQAIAGVLPAVVQIASVLSVSKASTKDSTDLLPPTETSDSALAYFATATGISFLTLLAFLWLLAVQERHTAEPGTAQDEPEPFTPKRRIPLLRLYRKTFYLSTAVFLTFAATMAYPVLTLQIQSVKGEEDSPRIFHKEAFIPLAFLLWNSGDLIGRLLAGVPRLRITQKPKTVLISSVARIAFVPLYFLCNRKGRGAVVKDDFFYLLFVQLLFGVTNGFIGTMCMMGAVEYVDVEEREAAGGFMPLMLVAGLTVGSLLSFAISAIP